MDNFLSSKFKDLLFNTDFFFLNKKFNRKKIISVNITLMFQANELIINEFFSWSFLWEKFNYKANLTLELHLFT